MYTLLIVDDDRAILDMLELALDRPELRLLCARSVQQALHAMREHTIDAALLDVHLSTNNRREGLDLVRTLRQTQPDAEVIVMTGSAEPGLRARADQAGARAFLRKPLSLPALERKLARLGLPARRCGHGTHSGPCWSGPARLTAALW